MDFERPADLQELYDATYGFARGLPGDDGPFDRSRWQACADQGLLGLLTPPEHGGLGLGAQAVVTVLEAFGRGGDPGLGFSVAAHLLACTLPVVRFGTDAQRARWLPALADGSAIATHAISEPDAGSDTSALRTRAEAVDGGWRLHGTKAYATNGPVADLALVHAVTRADPRLPGLTAFLIPAGQAGFARGAAYDKLGLRGSPIGDLFLDDCVVADDARLGATHAGAAVFSWSMAWERGCLFALYVGLMERQIDECVAWARRRKAFGRPIARFQAVSHRIADMRIRADASRLLVQKAAWALDRWTGRAPPPEVFAAKVFVSEAAVQTGLDAIAVFGGLGVLEEGGVARHLRDAVPATIFSGTNDIQRNLIASALGLG